ncbi:fas-binding factor 1-like isoform X1 [Epinephelus moara]|uniref:fas-binding factor 1-like isoform X1 n=1 Tax=Epinephelus moara TaxID=300413 RepID=UPI00214EC4C3|nr:fas-binding factor 1-like isoform X1 [Epinephelus moara]
MAAKLKGKPSQSLFGDDDLLDSLFDDEKFPVRGKATRSGPLNSTSATDNIFSMLAQEVKRDGGDTEDSDVSAADPNDILKNLKDMDDMDADLFASKKKPSSAPAQTEPKKDSATLESKVKPEGADEPTTGGRKPNSAPSSTTQNYRKLIFSDPDDPLADLDDLLPDETKPEPKSNLQQSKPEKSPSASPILKTETSKAAKKRRDLTFDDDDKDDLMDALGFDSDKSSARKKDSVLWSNKERSGTPQRPLTAVDGILESLTSPRLLERPATGEKKEQPQPQEKQQKEKIPTLKETLFEDDLTFGSYQPTLGSMLEGRLSRRQSVRFSTEDVSTPEKKPKPTTPTTLRHRNSADWLGLKTNDDLTFLEGDAKETKTSTESPKAPASPSIERRPSLTGSHATSAAKMAADTPATTDNVAKQTKPEVSKSQKKEEEEDDWLAGVLSRKKVPSVSKSEAKTSKQEDALGLGEEVDLESTVSKQVTSQAPRGREDTLTSVREANSPFLGQPSPSAHSTPVREARTEQDCPPQVTAPLPASAASVSLAQPHPQSQPQHLSSNKGSRVPSGPVQASDETLQQQPLPNPISAIPSGSVWSVPQQNQLQNASAAIQQQVTLSADSLQQLLLQQQMMQSQLLGLGGVVDAGLLQRLKEREQPPGDYQALQARIIQLEGQVKTLQLERDQSQMLLECVQQRHKQDMELMENAHKTRVKLLEESAAQRETQTRQECEDLMDRLAAVTRSAEQERSELQAQYQRKLAQAQQERDCEVERLKDLQRKSILEMKKDHEDHVQRLKKLKEEEIDAVTSATSQTRSLKVVIEQMEQFSSRLGDLSSRVESTHEHAAHGLEEGARHRDEQLRMVQDCLAQQQKAMAEERAYLKEVISRMDTQLSEQQRQLEKEQGDLKLHNAELKQKEMALAQEKETLDRLKEEVNREKEKISSTALRLKTRAQEVEAFSKLAAEKFEEGERALQEAKRVEAEHEARLRNIHTQAERLRQQEQRILQERVRLNHLQEDTERLRQVAPVTSLTQMIPPVLPDAGSVLPNPELQSTLNVPPPTTTSCANSKSMALQASLALWRYTSEKDQEFLAEEQIFLENLKKKSYRSPFNTD